MDPLERFEAYLATTPEFCLVYFSPTDYPILVIAANDTNNWTSPLRLACYEPHFKYFQIHSTGDQLFNLGQAKAYIPDEFEWDDELNLDKVVRL